MLVSALYEEVFHGTLEEIDLDSRDPDSSRYRAGTGDEGFFGVKAGKRWQKGGVFLKARPGFMHFSRDPFGVPKPGDPLFSTARARSTEPAIDLGGVVEYYTARGLILRLDLGKTLSRYARRTVRTSEFVSPYEAGGFTTRNWQGSFGIGIRF
jgi:hypothetical protein